MVIKLGEINFYNVDHAPRPRQIKKPMFLDLKKKTKKSQVKV